MFHVLFRIYAFVLRSLAILFLVTLLLLLVIPGSRPTFIMLVTYYIFPIAVFVAIKRFVLHLIKKPGA